MVSVRPEVELSGVFVKMFAFTPDTVSQSLEWVGGEASSIGLCIIFTYHFTEFFLLGRFLESENRNESQ